MCSTLEATAFIAASFEGSEMSDNIDKTLQWDKDRRGYK